MATHTVDRYRLFYWADTGRPSLRALVYCYAQGDEDTRPDVMLRFYSDEMTALPSNAVGVGADPERIYLNFRMADLEHVLGILRHEEPLFVHLSEASLRGYIATSEEEPIGDEI